MSTIVQRRFNKINSIQDANGNWLSKETFKLWCMIFFMRLFCDDNGPYHPHMLLHSRFPRLSTTRLAQLDKDNVASEAKKALLGMSPWPYKAPGPDGCQVLFFQKFWETTSNNLMHLVLNVLRGCNFSKDLNETSLVVIPKVPNSQIVTQLKPIGLCNIAYKTITKMMVDRLKMVMETLVIPTQCSFVPGQ